MIRFSKWSRVSIASSIAIAFVSMPRILNAEANPPLKQASEKDEKLLPSINPAAPYSLPWNLRSANASTTVRLDAALALQKEATTLASIVFGSYKFTRDWAVLARVPYVHHSPDGSQSGNVIGNSLIGITYTPELIKNLRLPVFFGSTLPIGMGGGNDRNATNYTTGLAGIYARSGMDNALFVVNYWALVAGAGLAYNIQGWTFQVECTFLELIRVRGDQVETDSNRTNFTTGLHVGYALLDWLTASGELRYQRWLTTPALVTKDESKREQATFAIGLRSKINLTSSIVARPGIAYMHPIDEPMTTSRYRIVFFDIPISF